MSADEQPKVGDENPKEYAEKDGNERPQEEEEDGTDEMQKVYYFKN
jgi:hypothetical protein